VATDFHLDQLQGKDPLVEVIVEVFSVTKLAKIVKKTSAKTFVFGSGCFCGDYKWNFIITKKNWVGGGCSGCFSSRCASWSIRTGAFSNIKHRCLHYTESTGRVLKYWGTGAFIQNNALVL
jgi:hypothetical protein